MKSVMNRIQTVLMFLSVLFILVFIPILAILIFKCQSGIYSMLYGIIICIAYINLVIECVKQAIKIKGDKNDSEKIQ